MANNNFGDRFGRAMSIARANIDPQYMLGAALGAGIRSLYDGYQERGKAKEAKEIYDSMPVANQDTQQGSSQGLPDMAILKDPADLLKSYGVELPEGMTADDVVASRDSFGIPQGVTVQPSPGLLNNQASIIASNMAQSAKPAEARAAQAAQGLLAQQRQMGDQTNQQLNQVVQEEEARKAQALQNAIKLGTMFVTGGANAGAEAAAGEAVAEQAGEEAIKKAAEEATTDAMKNMGVSSMQQYALDNNPYKKRSFTQGATQTQPSFEEAPELLPNLTNAERRGMNEIVQLKRSYQYFKDMYDNAEDEETAQKAQEGMAAVMKQANNLRNNYAKAGVNLDRLAGSQATLEDVTNRIQQDGIRKYNELTSGDNFMSSDQFYYKMFDRLREKGMSPEDAERFAKQYASRYQANLIARQSNALRDIGLDGNTINQVGAMLLANMARENPQMAQSYLSQFASPKDSWSQEMQMRQREHAASIQQALRNAVGGRGSGVGRSVTGSNGGSSNEPFDGTDYSANDYYSFIDSNVLPIKERNSRLADIDKRLSKLERDEDGYFNYSSGDKADLRERWFIHNRMDRMPRNSKEAWQWLTTMQEEALDGNGNKLFSNEKIAEYVEVWLGRYKAAGLEAYDGEAEDIYSAAVNGTQSDGRAAERAEQQRQQEEENRQRNGLAEYVSDNPGEQLSDDELSQYNTVQKANDELANKWTNKSVPTEQELSDEEKLRLWNQYIGR